jgi:hypothetical protein
VVVAPGARPVVERRETAGDPWTTTPGRCHLGGTARRDRSRAFDHPSPPRRFAAGRADRLARECQWFMPTRLTQAVSRRPSDSSAASFLNVTRLARRSGGELPASPLCRHGLRPVLPVRCTYPVASPGGSKLITCVMPSRSSQRAAASEGGTLGTEAPHDVVPEGSRASRYSVSGRIPGLGGGERSVIRAAFDCGDECAHAAASLPWPISTPSRYRMRLVDGP